MATVPRRGWPRRGCRSWPPRRDRLDAGSRDRRAVSRSPGSSGRRRANRHAPRRPRAPRADGCPRSRAAGTPKGNRESASPPAPGARRSRGTRRGRRSHRPSPPPRGQCVAAPCCSRRTPEPSGAADDRPGIRQVRGLQGARRLRHGERLGHLGGHVLYGYWDGRFFMTHYGNQDAFHRCQEQLEERRCSSQSRETEPMSSVLMNENQASRQLWGSRPPEISTLS